MKKISNLIPNSSNNIYLIILIGGLAYFAGEGILKSLQEFSLGGLARAMLPAISICVLILPFYLLKSFNIKGIILSNPKLSLRTVLLVGGLALILGVLLPWTFFSHYGLTTFLLITVVVLLFTLSLYFIVINKAYLSVVGFLLAFPIISYLENWFANFSTITNFSLSFLIITPSIIFILGILITSLFIKYRVQKNEINKYILLFLGVCISASLLSKDPVSSLRELSLELIFPLTVYFIIVRSYKTNKQIKLLIFSLIISLILISIINLYLFSRYQRDIYPASFDFYGRLFQTGLTSSLWASMVMMVLPLTLTLERQSIRARIFLFLTAIFFIGCIFISYSRAAQLTTVIVLFILFLRIKSSRKFVTLLFVILTFLFVIRMDFVRYYLSERYERIFVPKLDITRDTSFSHRRDAWYAATQIIKSNLLLGIGSGLWKDYVYLYAPKQGIVIEDRRAVQGYIATPHNYYLKVAVDSGTLGLIAYLTLLMAVFRVGLKFIKFSRNQSLKDIMLALLLSLVTWIASSMFLDNLYQGTFMGPGIIFWTIVAIVAILPNLKDYENTGEAQRMLYEKKKEFG